ncbi:MAG: hypothetical protein A2X12_10940 [Bacteroidetes bacterium GWE2_29_8]|nr:MAG: hypothetical protein A2X12_10940 [Bacteroidetes bacterium GWE2_29_8]OFY15997.1 MAG: hypothetical protein A2X02_05020 [Bacteroidetes bacterium GWF2_29_10]
MGNITKDSSFDSNKIYCHKIIYKYDSNGKLTEEEFYNFKGIPTKYIYKYDYKGDIIPRYIRKEPLDYYSIEKIIDKYDERGNILRLHYYWDNHEKLATSVYYKYDANNNLIEESVYKGDGNCNLIYYTNDDRGNWIKKIDKSYNKKDIFQKATIYKRIIEYHE